MGSTEDIPIKKKIEKLEQLPVETLFMIARKLSGPDALQFSRTSKKFQMILNDADLWRYYLKRDFSDAKLLLNQVHPRTVYEKEFQRPLKDIQKLIAFILHASGTHTFSNTQMLIEINSKISAITNHKSMTELTILRDEARAAIRADNIVDQDGDTPLMVAVRHGNIRNIQTLIAAGVNVNATHRTHRYTALHCAASCDRKDIVIALVTAGANVEAVGIYQNTPSHHARTKGRVDNLATLNQVINAKFAFNQVKPLLLLSQNERTPHLSSSANRRAGMPWLRDMPDELLLELAKKKSVIDAMRLSKVSQRFSEILNDSRLWEHYLKRDFPAVPLPINNGHPRKAYEQCKQLKDDIKKLADVIAFIQNPPNVHGYSWQESHPFKNIETLINIQFRISMINANTTIAQLSALKDEATAAIRADNILSIYGNTPLITAAAYNRTDIAQSLIAAGAKVNCTNNRGDTALMGAAFHGYKIFVQILLRGGAVQATVNHEGESAIMMVENKIKGNLAYCYSEQKVYKGIVNMLKQASAFNETKVLLLLSKPVRTLLEQNPILAKSCFR